MADFSRWHFDIDHYLNRFVPPPPWRWLPRPVSHFLGYRSEPPKPLGNLLIAFWALVGVFCGVAVVGSVSENIPSFQHRDIPKIVASFGAAAVLEFAMIESPFAQPRNAVISQILASVIGVGIAKLFALNANAHANPVLGGALACAITTAVMVLTNTVHPPAGATALLAVTEGYEIGWFLIPVMILGCVLMQAVALIVNNIQRRFPVYWWTPASLGRPKVDDVESAEKKEACKPTTSEDSLSQKGARIVIQQGNVSIPDSIWVSAEEREILMAISDRIS